MTWRNRGSARNQTFDRFAAAGVELTGAEWATDDTVERAEAAWRGAGSPPRVRIVCTTPGYYAPSRDFAFVPLEGR